jgi:hypothetical protein
MACRLGFYQRANLIAFVYATWAPAAGDVRKTINLTLRPSVIFGALQDIIAILGLDELKILLAWDCHIVLILAVSLGNSYWLLNGWLLRIDDSVSIVSLIVR